MYEIEDMELTRREAQVILTFYLFGAIVLALLGISELLDV
tara:strand:+ start:764 stop:883 length:120 start_codon:yes stop_codon:yes gene_type:complete